MGHDHAHHGHHAHAATPSGGAFALAAALNLGFVAAELVAGGWAQSMALIADAGHNLADALALLLAWGATQLSRRPPSPRFTYGLKSSSILAALANSALLWAAIGAILVETLQRLAHPAPVAGGLVMAVAAAGIVVNLASALLLAAGRRGDLNLAAAFQHLLADAAVAAGVVAAGGAVLLTGWRWIDPVASLAVLGIIAMGSWRLLREALRLGLAAVPAHVDEDAVRTYLATLPGVGAVHDLHIWPMSTTETALTAHLVMHAGHPGDDFLHRIADELAHGFAIPHATLQVETGDGHSCALHSERTV